VTYNGDYFDWPFMDTRAAKYGLDMAAELGVRVDRQSGEALSRSAVHMDCLHWVNRDSYLPQGSRGLKASARAAAGLPSLLARRPPRCPCCPAAWLPQPS
jgi:DNA polymerase epsilon subunit 1